MKASIIGAAVMFVILGALYFVTNKSPAPTDAAPAATEAQPASESGSSSNFKL